MLDSVTEQQRFAQFLQQMPGICAVGQRPAQVLLSFLTAMVDAQVRPHAKPLQNFPKTSVVFPWCDRLSKAKATFEDLPRQLGHAYENWTFPVREYLVNPPDFALKQPLFRACFQLLPPPRPKTIGNCNMVCRPWEMRQVLSQRIRFGKIRVNPRKFY
ncbi:hypothetical protein [Synechococcus sp. 7002]|uniref:hypothetical protein n=1 Tax=Synechococcus sp. 7002 TaxID=1938862 RepID=UPI001F15C8E5|nr:hypothetical protein [Synechococcus sp. 7002]